jgi:PilZ domain
MAASHSQSHSANDQRLSLRRRDERHRICATALVHCHGRFQTVQIVDFSLGGMQLQQCFGVGVADQVTVELLSGQRLEAKVAWSMGSKLGIRFLQPLSSDHPATGILQEHRTASAPAQSHSESA